MNVLGKLLFSAFILAFSYNNQESLKAFLLTLKAPITTAADDIHKYFFIVFQRKLYLMFQVNPLLGRGFT